VIQSAAPARRVRFGDIMRRVERKVLLDDAEEYERVGVRWYGNGAFVRDCVLGAEIARKQQWVIHEGDLVYNKLFAWKGAFAVADSAVDRRIVSDKFPTYEINRELVDPQFLAYFFKTPGLAVQAEHLSKGAAAISKLTLNPPQFWDITIPLPSLAQQREIVAQLAPIGRRVERAASVHTESCAAVEALGAAFLREHRSECVPTPLANVVTLRRPDVNVDPEGEYKFAGVYSFGRGVFAGPIKRGSEFSYQHLTRLSKDDFVYPKLMAWEGAFGVATEEHAGLVVSPEFPVFELNKEQVLPETLRVYFGQQDVWAALAGTSRGTNVRRRRLHPKTFLAHAMPLPPMHVQLSLRDLVSRTHALNGIQANVVGGLTGLMPAILDRVFEGELR
jgi:type I restriction enzyme, S subunit